MSRLVDGSAAPLQGFLASLILADQPLPDGPEHDAVAQWVRKGGLLVRFAERIGLNNATTLSG